MFAAPAFKIWKMEKTQILPRPVTECRKLAKTCEASGYDYLLICFKRPEKGEVKMDAEVGYHLTEPGNLASLLATLWTHHPDVAQALEGAIAFRAMLSMAKEQGAEKKDSKIIQI